MRGPLLKNCPFSRRKPKGQSQKLSTQKVLLVHSNMLFCVFALVCLLFSLTRPQLALAKIDPDRPPPLLSDEPSVGLMQTYSLALAQERYGVVETTINRIKSGRGDDSTVYLWGNLLFASWSVTMSIDLGDGPIGQRASVQMQNARVGFEHLEGVETDSRKLAAVEEALGTLGMLDAQILSEIDGKTLASLEPAANAADHFHKALALDSTRLNARAGLLLYDFWKSNALRFITWMPFVPDHRPAAIDGLYRIARSSHPAAPGTAVALTWVLIESGRLKEAAQLADSLLAQWGEVRGVLEPAGKAYFLMERWDDAADRYSRLAESIRSAPRLNETRLIGALHRLGHIYAAQQKWDEVRRVAREADSLSLTPDQRKRKKDDLNRLHELDREAQKRLGPN